MLGEVAVDVGRNSALWFIEQDLDARIGSRRPDGSPIADAFIARRP